jgi:peptidoglycan/xylan/chitin deacetylase (PgdA/CDA1 family)
MFKNLIDLKKVNILLTTIMVFGLTIVLAFGVPSLARHNNWWNNNSNNNPPPVAQSSAIISIEFDDGWKSAYQNGLPILNKYNIKTTQAIISGANENGNLVYVTDNQIRDYSNQGHDISSHSVTHRSLFTLSDVQMREEFLNSRNKLQNLIGKKVPYFVAPYCEFGTREANAARGFYQYARGCFTGSENTPNNIDIRNLDSKIVEQGTSIDTFNSWIANAKKNNSLLILVYHKVSQDTSPDAYSVTPQTLDAQMSIVSRSGLKIQTTNTALRTLGKI